MFCALNHTTRRIIIKQPSKLNNFQCQIVSLFCHHTYEKCSTASAHSSWRSQIIHEQQKNISCKGNHRYYVLDYWLNIFLSLFYAFLSSFLNLFSCTQLWRFSFFFCSKKMWKWRHGISINVSALFFFGSMSHNQ